MFRNILIPTDGSDLAAKAVEQGVLFAKEIGAKITAVTVTEPFHLVSVKPSQLEYTPIEYQNYSKARRRLNNRAATPSSRTLSPLKYPLVIISSANAAYSSGRPRRFGNGTEAASPAFTLSGARCSSGVSKIPGKIVLTRMPSSIRSRATGKVRPTTPAFEAEYAAWPICPSSAATEAVLRMTPRS